MSSHFSEGAFQSSCQPLPLLGMELCAPLGCESRKLKNAYRLGRRISDRNGEQSARERDTRTQQRSPPVSSRRPPLRAPAMEGTAAAIPALNTAPEAPD